MSVKRFFVCSAAWLLAFVSGPVIGFLGVTLGVFKMLIRIIKQESIIYTKYPARCAQKYKERYLVRYLEQYFDNNRDIRSHFVLLPGLLSFKASNQKMCSYWSVVFAYTLLFFLALPLLWLYGVTEGVLRSFTYYKQLFMGL